jgi:tRNA threonylcarbamoyladenosine biosynthesis protein TsaE
MSPDFTYQSQHADATLAVGRWLGELCQPGDVILLEGTLGAGKTCLTQGIVRGLGSDEYAASPTFVLVRQIEARLTLYHADLYRLDSVPEIIDLGLDEYFYGHGLTVVEWADRGYGALPAENLTVQISITGDDARTLVFKAHGTRHRELLAALAARIAEGVGA